MDTSISIMMKLYVTSNGTLRARWFPGPNINFITGENAKYGLQAYLTNIGEYSWMSAVNVLAKSLACISIARLHVIL